MKQFMQLLYNDKKHYEEFIENQIETLGVTAKQYMYPNIDALIPVTIYILTVNYNN